MYHSNVIYLMKRKNHNEYSQCLYLKETSNQIINIHTSHDLTQLIFYQSDLKIIIGNLFHIIQLGNKLTQLTFSQKIHWIGIMCNLVLEWINHKINRKTFSNEDEHSRNFSTGCT